MTARGRIFAGLLVGLSALGSELSAQVSATIYNDGRVLVRRTIPMAVPRGLSTQRLSLGQFDPGSLFSLDPDVGVLGVRYDGAIDDAALLRRAIGRTLVFRSGMMLRDTVSATVLSVSPFRLRMADGSIITTPLGTPSYPAEAAFLQPGLDVTLRSSASRSDLHLGYFGLGGGGWQASYQAVFAGGQARLSGMAVINAGMLALDSAELQLLAGQVSQATGGARGYMKTMNAPAALQEARIDAATQEQKVGEFHLYTLAGRVSLAPGVTTTTALFDPANAPYEKTYTVDGVLPYWGGISEDGNGYDIPVGVTYVVRRV
ncbi:MAG: hypothetical protein ACHQXA_10280, partial [Gemmatimonadales bacterium]